MGVTIRRADVEDVTALVALNRLVQGAHVTAEPTYFKAEFQDDQVEDFFRKLLIAQSNAILIALVDDLVVGYIWFEAQSRAANAFKHALRRIYIHHIAVFESAQGHGVGSSLLDAVEAQAEAQGIVHVALDTWTFNTKAQTFFQRRGFELFNIVMRKELPRSS